MGIEYCMSVKLTDVNDNEITDSKLLVGGDIIKEYVSNETPVTDVVFSYSDSKIIDGVKHYFKDLGKICLYEILPDYYYCDEGKEKDYIYSNGILMYDLNYLQTKISAIMSNTSNTHYYDDIYILILVLTGLKKLNPEFIKNIYIMFSKD